MIIFSSITVCVFFLSFFVYFQVRFFIIFYEYFEIGIFKLIESRVESGYELILRKTQSQNQQVFLNFFVRPPILVTDIYNALNISYKCQKYQEFLSSSLLPYKFISFLNTYAICLYSFLKNCSLPLEISILYYTYLPLENVVTHIYIFWALVLLIHETYFNTF